MTSSTIAAIATPAGRGGIGIVRISGPQSFSIGSHLFKAHKDPCRKDSGNHFPYTSHRVYFGQIQNFLKTTFLDEVLVVFMKSPNSYTREDVVEIHGHAGLQTLTLILKAVFEAGAEPAEPGEFTKRAYLNGRIDLTQAEAVIDLINARSDLAREIAFSQLSGDLKKALIHFQNILMTTLTQLQAEIEFPEEVISSNHNQALSQKLQYQVIAPIKDLIDNHDQSFFLTQGLRTIIIGEPNVGKSSVMNRLARKEKSIVTPHPGTTRDLIEEHVHFSGTPMVLTDTAGLHESDDPVESIGIDIARKQIRSADLVLFVLQAGRTLTENEIRICDLLLDKPVIFIFNKIDLIQDLIPTVLPSSFSSFPSVHISALQNSGMDALEKAIEDFITRKISVFHDPILPNVRHQALLKKTLDAMQRFVDGLASGVPGDLLVIDLDEALQHLNNITGQVFQIDLLDQIFNNFCIGK